ncbi:MAG: MFS transporter [Bacteroidetes bacterium]|nr:MFS transporter [Bacteroidota bacterium]
MKREVKSPVRSGLKISTIEGGFANFQYILMQSSYLMGLGLLFGLSETTLSVLASFSYLFQIFYFLSVYLLGGWVERKKFVLTLAFFSRFSWVLPAFLLLTETPESFSWLFITVFSLYFLMDKLLAHSWNSWMSDLVPVRLRGKYFGFRQGFSALVSIVFHFLIASVLDHFRAEGHEPAGFAILLGISSVMGVVTVILFRYQHHPEGIKHEPREIFPISSLKILFLDRQFTIRLGIVALIMMSIGMVMIFIPVYTIELAGHSYSFFALYQNGILLLGVAGYRAFGYLIDRRGPDFALKLSIGGLCLSAGLWVFLDPSWLILFWADSILLGFCYSGFLLTQSTLVLSNPADPDRNLRIAVFGSVSGLMYFAGSLLAGQIYSVFSGHPFEAVHLIFIVTLIIRIFVLILTQLPHLFRNFRYASDRNPN